MWGDVNILMGPGRYSIGLTVSEVNLICLFLTLILKGRLQNKYNGKDDYQTGSLQLL